jgi:hypothetical protein
VDGLCLSGWLYPKGPDQCVAGAIHEDEDRPEYAPKDEQRSRANERDPARKIQCDGLGGELARNHVDEGDRGKRQSQRQRVNSHARLDADRQEQGPNQPGQRGLADPPQPETGERNSELCGRNGVIEMLDRGLDRARTASTLSDPDLDLRAANRNERKFSSDEEGVGGNEYNDPEDTED